MSKKAAGAGLGKVGKTATGVFQQANTLADKVAETIIKDAEGDLDGWGDADLPPTPASDEDDLVTFQRSFYIYGGTEFCEELDHLASECTMRCNRARAKMLKEARSKYERMLAEVGDLCNLEEDLDADEDLGEADGEGRRADNKTMRRRASRLRCPRPRGPPSRRPRRWPHRRR